MRLWVDPQKCFGHGLCLEDTADLFGWDDESNKAIANEGEVPPDREAKAREAVRCCPEQAIVVLDVGEIHPPPPLSPGEIHLPPPLPTDSNHG